MNTLSKKGYPLYPPWIIFYTIIIMATACGDDDSQNLENDLLIGSWELLREDGELVDYTLIITFQASGDYQEFYEDDFGSETDSGTWSFITDTKVRITYGPGDTDDFDIISINATRLIVEDEDGDDYELVKV